MSIKEKMMDKSLNTDQSVDVHVRPEEEPELSGEQNLLVDAV